MYSETRSTNTQFTGNMQSLVGEVPEVWNNVIAQVSVSHRGFAAMKNLLFFEKSASASVPPFMETPAWKLYAEGVQFVLANRPIVEYGQMTTQAWELLLWGIFQYQEIEDVVVDIVVLMDRSKKTNFANRNIYDEMISKRASSKNCESLTCILFKFADNPRIEPTLMTLLSDMFRESMPGQNFDANFHAKVQLAMECIFRAIRNRSEKSALPALGLLWTMCSRYNSELCACLQKDKHDIVLIMLEVHETFNEFDSIVEKCSIISRNFIGTWTAPTPPPTHAIVDRILSCMQEYPGCLSRQNIGCQQLRDICKCNGRDSKYSSESILCVVNFIQQIQNESAGINVYDKRVWHLWTFVDEVMRNINTYNECMHLFSVEFLQNALACNFATYESALEANSGLESDRATITIDCVQFICSLLKRILTSRPMDMAAFVRQDGISGLVKIAHHHTKPVLASEYTQRFAGNIACVDLLLDILVNQDANAIKLFTISLLGGRKIERKFSVGVLLKNDQPTTLCKLLVQTLDLQLIRDIHKKDCRNYTHFYAERINKTLRILSLASEEGNIVCTPMQFYMRIFLAFVVRFIKGIKRDISNEASHILEATVASCDNLIINVYTVISTDCMESVYSLWNEEKLQDYKEVSIVHRCLFSTFDKTISNITEALGEIVRSKAGR